jgi:hypothetical protein
VVLDETLLRRAKDAAARLTDAQHRAEVSRADYHHAIRRLHLAGGSLRAIADALGLSHQRVHQIVEASGGGPEWRPRRKATADLACTFCGSSTEDVTKLIAGPGVSICDECVALASLVVTDNRSHHTARGQIDPVPDGTALDCTFCGKAGSEVGRLAAGPGVRICRSCVEFCQEVLAASIPGPTSPADPLR